MSYLGGGSLSLTASGYGPGDYSNCHKQISGSVNISAGSNILSFSLTSSTNTSANNPKARVILYVRDNYNSNDSTNIICSYDSGYPSNYSVFPFGNTTVTGTLDTRGFTNLRIDLCLYVSNNGNTLSGSKTGYISRTTYYGVTFNLNGGTRTGGGATYQEIAHGGSATPPSVSKSGYNFAGWSGSYTSITSDRTITATWTLATASFNINILLPDGSEPYSTGEAGSIEFSSDGGVSYTRVSNEPANSYAIGTVFKFRNFKPGTGLKLDSVSGATLGTDGAYTATLTSSGLTVNFYTLEREPQNVYLDNGVIYARAFVVDENLTTVEIDSQGNVYASAFNSSADNFYIGKGVLYAVDFIEGCPS